MRYWPCSRIGLFRVKWLTRLGVSKTRWGWKILGVREADLEREPIWDRKAATLIALAGNQGLTSDPSLSHIFGASFALSERVMIPTHFVLSVKFMRRAAKPRGWKGGALDRSMPGQQGRIERSRQLRDQHQFDNEFAICRRGGCRHQNKCQRIYTSRFG